MNTTSGLQKNRRGVVTKFISKLKDEGKHISYLAGPMVVVTICVYLVQVVSSMMVGHPVEFALSTAIIAISIAGVIGCNFLTMFVYLFFNNRVSFFNHLTNLHNHPFLTNTRSIKLCMCLFNQFFEMFHKKLDLS